MLLDSLIITKLALKILHIIFLKFKQENLTEFLRDILTIVNYQLDKSHFHLCFEVVNVYYYYYECMLQIKNY